MLLDFWLILFHILSALHHSFVHRTSPYANTALFTYLLPELFQSVELLCPNSSYVSVLSRSFVESGFQFEDGWIPSSEIYAQMLKISPIVYVEKVG